MTGFIIGVFVGGFIGVGLMALMRLAGECEKDLDCGDELPEGGDSNEIDIPVSDHPDST